jgi:cytochrome c oxidase accessory protein FixG
MAVHPQPVSAPGRVLSTLNEDGSRRWLRPRPSPGGWWRSRRTVAWLLILVFVVLPHLRLAGRPLVLLDLPRREFTLFGTTFLPTETVLFMLLFISTLIGIFLVTALFGRVWCGWGCPQTVYLEFVFRPIEYAIEGGPRGVQAIDQLGLRGQLHPRRLAKHAVFMGLAMAVAHTFLAYFVGTDQLAVWMTRSPVEHPTSFIIMAGVTALMFFDFSYFREQTCLVACPYGRLQSVLLDRSSLIVGYDGMRGEPRARGAARTAASGDCVDCGLCVQTCPTGIDIRQGLQMECIHCTQCMDACDAVMLKVGRPAGLIRYGSQDRFAGRATSMLRPRVLLYPLVLAITGGLFLWLLTHRSGTEITLLRGVGAPYMVEADGSVVNQLRLKVRNRGSEPRRYAIALEDAPGVRMIAPINPLPVPPAGVRETSVFIVIAPSQPRPRVHLRIADGTGWSEELPWTMLGPTTGGGSR